MRGPRTDGFGFYTCSCKCNRMGYIDHFSDHTLYDVLDGNMSIHKDPETGEYSFDTFEFYGFHIVPQNEDGGKYHVQLDGHAGTLDEIKSDDYDDVLELVDDLMSHVFLLAEYDYQDDQEALVEWAGRIMTGNKDRADEDPGTYLYVPEDYDGD